MKLSNEVDPNKNPWSGDGNVSLSFTSKVINYLVQSYDLVFLFKKFDIARSNTFTSMTSF